MTSLPMASPFGTTEIFRRSAYRSGDMPLSEPDVSVTRWRTHSTTQAGHFWNARCDSGCGPLPNVTLMDGYDMVAPTANVEGDRVTGARVVNRDNGIKATLTADMVVDATGRGSRAPGLLAILGYGAPPEDELTVRLAYVGQSLPIPSGA